MEDAGPGPLVARVVRLHDRGEVGRDRGRAGLQVRRPASHDRRAHPPLASRPAARRAGCHGLAVGKGDLERAVGQELELPAVVVHEVLVMAVADRQQVVEVGGAAVLPPPDVMHLAASRTARSQPGIAHVGYSARSTRRCAALASRWLRPRSRSAGGQIATTWSLARAATSAARRAGRSTGSPQSTVGLPSASTWVASTTTMSSGLPDRCRRRRAAARCTASPARYCWRLDRIVGRVVRDAVGEQPVDLVVDPLVDPHRGQRDRSAMDARRTSRTPARPTTATGSTSSCGCRRRRLASGAPRPSTAARTRCAGNDRASSTRPSMIDASSPRRPWRPGATHE